VAPWLFIFMATLVGLVIGSFLNVVVYRLPIMLQREWRSQSRELLTAEGIELPAPSEEEPFNLVTPRSCCPHCKTPIKAWQNVPLISFAILRGRCAACGAQISWRYPIVELLTGLLSGLVAWHFGFGMQAFGAILLTWALIGWLLQGDALPEVFSAIPVIAVVAYAAFPLLLAIFRGRIAAGLGLSERPIMKAFRQANALQVGTIMLLRSPALVAAVFVYTLSLQLFGVEDVSFGRMLGVLPVIFFGAATPGPMRTVAITLWVALFPGYEGQMTAFGFVQHNFFIFFNAAIGLLFLRRANREIFQGRDRLRGEAQISSQQD